MIEPPPTTTGAFNWIWVKWLYNFWDIGWGLLNPANANSGDVLIADGNGDAEWGPINTYLSPTSITVTDGASTDTVSDMQVASDGNEYNLNEVTGTPGFDLRIEFTSVTSVAGVVMRSYYDGTHHVEISLFNYDTTSWDQIIYGADAEAYNYRTILIPDGSNYFDSGNAIIRVFHPDTGNINHDYFIDYVALIESPGVTDSSSASVEGTDVLSTGEAGGTKFLREDGDGTSSWQALAGGGDMLSANNLSDVADAGTSRTNLGVAIGSDVQAWAAVLDATTASFLTADETFLDALNTAIVTNANAQAMDISILETVSFYGGEDTPLVVNRAADQTSTNNVRFKNTANSWYIGHDGTDFGINFNSATAGSSTFEIDVSGNVTVTGTVDGRDLATDGTKLDGIEALADVTDTANVTSAGALMDSEVDADIKTLVLPASTTISAFGATLTDDADAATARTTLSVDVAGTDNSTDVTLAGQDYLTLSTQQITANKIAIDDLADGTDGELITWSATGVAAVVAVGTSGHVLTSNGVGAAPTFQASGGGGFNVNPASFSVSGSHDITTTESTIVFDTEDFDPDTNYSNASGEITVTDAGYYYVSVNVPVNDDGSGGAARGRVFGFLQRDQTTSTWITVNNIRGQDYHRETSGGSGLHAAGIVLLAASELIRFRIDVSSTTDVSTESGECCLNIHKIRET